MERAIPILPSRDLDATLAFYARLGFKKLTRDVESLNLARGPLELRFARTTTTRRAGFVVCVADEAAWQEAWSEAGQPEARDGARTLVDPDGNLVIFASEPQPAGIPAGWRLVGGKLEKSYRFRDWAAAFAFVTNVSALAERMNHHPDVTLVWGRVDLSLWSHDAKRVTERDTRLARAIDGG